MKARIFFPVLLAMSIALPACAGGYYSAPYSHGGGYGSGYYQTYPGTYGYGYRPAPVYRSYGEPWHHDHHWQGHPDQWRGGDHGHQGRWEHHGRHHHD